MLTIEEKAKMIAKKIIEDMSNNNLRNTGAVMDWVLEDYFTQRIVEGFDLIEKMEKGSGISGV